MPHDRRHDDLARLLTTHSTRLKKGEHVLLHAFDVPEEMVVALLRAVRARGAFPHVLWQHGRVQRELLRGAEDEALKVQAQVELARMKKMDAYIALRGSDNLFEYGDVPPKKMQLAMSRSKPVIDHRVNHTKWVVLRWPSPGMAQAANRSTEAFEEFYFRVCTMDYGRMSAGMNALKRLMEKTDRVEIKGPGTDLSFSIKGIGAMPCGGQYNIPDGECFTAPVKDSVEGEITYNVPSEEHGIRFENIRFVFEKGRIVHAEAGDNTKKLNTLLDADPGARFIGEFAIGFNPHIREPMLDTLFDEKIAGSFHFTPGQSYEECGNGNRSSVHWDIVSIQRPDYGGGEIHFDGKLIRKDGLFQPKSLWKLNPDYLLGKGDGAPGKAAKKTGKKKSSRRAR